ncbi:MAG TPA: hypothetical protein VFB03_00005, partial [Candidatus Saccharimonadales bacterium]|nr:hypothetical protein [Candidatus Saccharimonadales bacterium]
SGTFKGPEAESGFGPRIGANIVLDIFYTNNRTYIAEYDQEPNYEDVLGEFNLMVTKTLEFSAN